MTGQLSFDLPAKPALGRDDFFVAPSNAMAVAMIDRPEHWPGGKLVLAGPSGSGKTHLTHVWAAQVGARIIAARDLTEADVPELARGPIAVEDVPDIANRPAPQTALFHLHNLLQSEGRRLLMTGQLAPNLWTMSLADLQSRIDAAPHVMLDPPEDQLLAAILAKLFSDRQIVPKPDVIPYLVGHIDRSFEAAADAVERLDRAALAETRTLSRPLAVKLLSETS